LLLIVSEAISNATRHGNASTIRVALSANGGLRLAISDDGCGFHDRIPTNGHDRGSTNGSVTGFGMTSMRERVQELGGELRLRSRPGEGTEVEVMLP
jgi:signal transduction histidine kinase